ncbi:taurine dioxygenase [Pseudomonas fluorescens]|uniref:Taurine dioxygenase n=1 Tax=Pseudomonas fluorescens TaxID=294 RepID=A0A1T2Y217_PSEFL|nr:taurine dioxygenase [Pseudomonas fluorescens]OPA86096.1 taurine dioxygenase [Pseudomonas fluorescens]
MNLSLRPLGPAIGAEVEGLDMSQPLSEQQRHWVEHALLQHQVLFFRNQSITAAEHVAFAACFGDLHRHPIYPHVDLHPELLLIDTAVTDVRDNAIWHTDVTFLAAPAMGSVLAARQVPDFGGDTLWANGVAAFDALSAPLRSLLDGLTATHELTKSFPTSRFGNTPQALERYEKARRDHPPLSHPVVRTHPATGRKALFVNEGFTTRINELEAAESDTLLRFLFSHVSRPEFKVRWQWKANDVAFWDNRITQHYAIDDYRPQRRIMHRATILGDVPF